MNKGLGFRQEPFDTSKITEAIERGYLSKRREPGQQKKVSFAPSSIGGYQGVCPRYWFLAFTGAHFEETFDAMGFANMANGSAAHDRIQQAFEDAGILVAAEVEAKIKNPPIRGYIDALVRIDGEVLVCEIKTTRQEGFIFRQNTGKPMAQHLYQVLIYLKATGKKNGFLLYENKNDNSYTVIPVEYNEKNEKILQEALDWLTKVYENWESGKLPERPFTQRNKICKGCPVFNECWSGEPGVVRIDPMVVAKP